MKNVCKIALIFSLSLSPKIFAQDYLYGHKKERKKVWNHWGRKKDAYNPYLDKKKNNKPSAKIDKDQKRETKKQRRQYKRQLKRAKR